VVRDTRERGIKERLVARDGKLVTVKEELGGAPAPNGTAWSVTLEACPELDETNLVIGRVVEGMDVVRLMSEQPRVEDNSGSPYFKVAKAIGDKRVDVAERFFLRPYNRIVCVRCGVLENKA
jgi:peptidyl-prolyl cis-trans isomerase B (cyclophilin B)